jgi:hypothetical protein
MASDSAGLVVMMMKRATRKDLQGPKLATSRPFLLCADFRFSQRR